MGTIWYREVFSVIFTPLKGKGLDSNILYLAAYRETRTAAVYNAK